MAADGKGIAFPSLGAREGEPLKNLPLAKMIKPSKNAWGNRKKTRMLSTALANAEKRDDGVLKVEDLSAKREREKELQAQKDMLKGNTKDNNENTNGTTTNDANGVRPAHLDQGKEFQRVLVLDAGAFISGVNLASRFGAGYRYVTIQGVLDEIKDERSRRVVETFPFKIDVLQVEKTSYEAVHSFAKLSGDLHFLSITDIRVLALTYQFEAQIKGTGHLRSRPKTNLQATESEGEKFKNKSENRGPDIFSLKYKAKPFNVDKYLFAFPPILTPNPSIASIDTKEFHEREQKGEGEEETKVSQDLEEEYDEGEWITPDNVDDREFDLVPVGNAGENGERKSSVSCVTTDFTMQNVCLQIGLGLKSPDGRSINTVRRWQLQCYSCFHNIIGDLSKQFCPRCGNASLARVSVTVENGIVRYRRSNRAVNNKRGTIYSIPLPKGGRNNQDLILREDVMKKKNPAWSKPKPQSAKDAFKSGSTFALSSTGPPRAWVNRSVYGYGRRNPNEVKKQRRRKKH
ncbi:hypothetical protein AAMO2058_001434800 [Amorphochlora amoebiformis]